MTTGQRIKSRRKELEVSAEKIAEAIGVSPATIYRYENGDIEKVPGEVLLPIAKVLRTTPAYLMGWEDTPDNSAIAGIEPMPSFTRKPRLGVIACGTPILAEQNIETYDEVPDFIHCDFTLTCKGDSMINARIYDGDIVYIREQPDVENGQIAAIRIDNEATLKRVYKSAGQVILQPENPAYAPMVYQGEQLSDLHIIGLVVAFTSMAR